MRIILKEKQKKSIFYYCLIIPLLFSCNQNKVSPSIGKYINKTKLSYLDIYSDSTYKLTSVDTIFRGHWVFIEPNQIGFKNWQDINKVFFNYKFGIVKKGQIIFDLDNEPNNYFIIKD